MLKLNNVDDDFIKTDKIIISNEKKYSNYNDTLESYI